MYANFQRGGPTHATPRPLTISVVYEVNQNWYGYHFDRVCILHIKLAYLGEININLCGNSVYVLTSIVHTLMEFASICVLIDYF